MEKKRYCPFCGIETDSLYCEICNRKTIVQSQRKQQVQREIKNNKVISSKHNYEMISKLIIMIFALSIVAPVVFTILKAIVAVFV